MFGLALLFVYGFLLSFYHFDHLAWGRGGWSLWLSCICFLAMRTCICVTFLLPPGIRGWLRLLLVALPGLFCLPFFTLCYRYVTQSFPHKHDIWAVSWQNQQNDMCAQRRLRSAWASVQSAQSFRRALNGQSRTQAFFMRTAKTLIRLGTETILLVLPCGGSNFDWVIFPSFLVWHASYLDPRKFI